MLGFLFGTALPIYFLNKPLNANFYFLNDPYADGITRSFAAVFGEKYYILGFLPAVALVLAVMYLPWMTVNMRRKNR